MIINHSRTKFCITSYSGSLVVTVKLCCYFVEFANSGSHTSKFRVIIFAYLLYFVRGIKFNILQNVYLD